MKKNSLIKQILIFLLFLIIINFDNSIISKDTVTQLSSDSDYEFEWKSPDYVSYEFGDFKSGSLDCLSDWYTGTFSVKSIQPPWNPNYKFNVIFYFNSAIEIWELHLNYYVKEINTNDALGITLIYENKSEFSLGLVDEGNCVFTNLNFNVGSIKAIKFSRSLLWDYFYVDFHFIYLKYRVI